MLPDDQQAMLATGKSPGKFLIVTCHEVCLANAYVFTRHKVVMVGMLAGWHRSAEIVYNPEPEYGVYRLSYTWWPSGLLR